ncbi:hypothetical protein D0869_15955 [Hortaea werneckii]|uniref:Uncharacterized protein n=1 Tax=Hortaea werneckii TaxID=91943 RepID=A0A3M6VXW1_HORWE|nr:hypothetical protein D0869_15955 [Hortaea werneckii]
MQRRKDQDWVLRQRPQKARIPWRGKLQNWRQRRRNRRRRMKSRISHSTSSSCSPKSRIGTSRETLTGSWNC